MSQVVFIESIRFNEFPNVFNRIHQSGNIVKGCFERECVLGIYIDNSIQNVNISDLNTSLYNYIEGFIFIERSTDHAEFHSLYAFPTADAATVLTDLIFRSFNYVTLRETPDPRPKVSRSAKQYDKICAIIDLANNYLQPIIKIYADLNFKSPCIYVRCKITNIPYPYPFIGLIYGGNKTMSAKDVISKSKNLVYEFNDPDEILEIKGEKIDEISKKCLEGYLLKKFIFEGGYGIVYQSCDITNNCKYAIKMQLVEDEDEAITWRREMENMKMLSENYDIGPKFIGAWTCDLNELGIIVSELWDGALKTKECPPLAQRNKIEDQISQLHDLGLVHGDILEKNILVRRDKDGNITDATLTDFGFLNTPEGWQDDRDFLSKIFDYHMQHITTKLYYKKNNFDFEDIYDNPYQLDRGLTYYWETKC